MNKSIFLKAIDFGKIYCGKKVLSDVNFEIKEGEIIGLLGKNGAGKSTLLKAITGIHPYEQGTIEVNGKELKSNYELVKDFGVLIESNFLNYLTGYENLKLLLQLDEKIENEKLDEEIDRILKIVELKDAKKKKVKDYSYGMKQRLGLAQALLTSKTFTVLDEPFLGLDPIGKDIVKKAISNKAKEGVPIIFSSHDLDDVAEICDHIILIKDGTVSYDGPMKKRIEFRLILDKVKKDVFSGYKNIQFEDNNVICLLDEDELVNDFLSCIINNDMKIIEIETNDRSLVDMFYEELKWGYWK